MPDIQDDSLRTMNRVETGGNRRDPGCLYAILNGSSIRLDLGWMTIAGDVRSDWPSVAIRDAVDDIFGMNGSVGSSMRVRIGPNGLSMLIDAAGASGFFDWELGRPNELACRFMVALNIALIAWGGLHPALVDRAINHLHEIVALVRMGSGVRRMINHPGQMRWCFLSPTVRDASDWLAGLLLDVTIEDEQRRGIRTGRLDNDDAARREAAASALAHAAWVGMSGAQPPTGAQSGNTVLPWEEL